MSARNAVASDSETERTATKKRQSKKGATPSEEEEPEGLEQAEEEEDGEEYEIEAILDAKQGTFVQGRYGFLVKWKGYDESHNSWVDEADAGNATELIDQYWDKKKRRKSGIRAKAVNEPRSEAKKKRGRPSRSKAESTDQEEMNVDESENERPNTTKRVKKNYNNSSTKKRNPPSSEPDEISADNLIGMEKWRNLDSWEDLVHNVDTIEREDGSELTVYFTLTTGEHTKQPSSVCSDKFPMKMLKFYEAHLRWKDAGEPHSE